MSDQLLWEGPRLPSGKGRPRQIPVNVAAWPTGAGGDLHGLRVCRKIESTVRTRPATHAVYPCVYVGDVPGSRAGRCVLARAGLRSARLRVVLLEQARVARLHRDLLASDVDPLDVARHFERIAVRHDQVGDLAGL